MPCSSLVLGYVMYYWRRCPCFSHQTCGDVTICPGPRATTVMKNQDSKNRLNFLQTAETTQLSLHLDVPIPIPRRIRRRLQIHRSPSIPNTLRTQPPTFLISALLLIILRRNRILPLLLDLHLKLYHVSTSDLAKVLQMCVPSRAQGEPIPALF